MLKPEDMSDELRNALIHSGIDDPEDYLAHYGVKGMQWGRRKTDRAERKAGGGRIATLKTKKGKPLVSVVKRTSPLKSITDKTKAAFAKAKANRIRMNKAYDKAYKDLYKDNRKTMILGLASTLSFVGAAGGLGIAILSKKPSTKIGASVVSIALTATSHVTESLESDSRDRDILEKYGN
jgi:hypothetical protein